MPKLTTTYVAAALPGSIKRAATVGDRLWLQGEWRSPRHDFVMFMHNATNCHACRLMQSFGANIVARSLHVAVAGNRLVVTEADDLHVPGRSLSAQWIMDLASVSVYRLLSDPLPGVDPGHHAPAAGIAVLSWPNGRRRLKVTGVAEGLATHHDCIFDAVENGLSAG